MENLNGMYHLNGLLTVCGKNLIYTPDEAGAAAVTLENAVADSKKTLVTPRAGPMKRRNMAGPSRNTRQTEHCS